MLKIATKPLQMRHNTRNTSITLLSQFYFHNKIKTTLKSVNGA